MELRNAKTHKSVAQIVVLFCYKPFICFNFHADGEFHCRYRRKWEYVEKQDIWR